MFRRGVERFIARTVCLLLTLGIVGIAKAAASQFESQTLPQLVEGPPPPVAPEVITRDDQGRATARAVRVDEPLNIDGELDESIYTRVTAMSDFIQNDPDEGALATERTDVWILFDDEHVYVVARCWETQPDRIIANEMRRDNTRIVRDDNFAWSFDTFYDRRNVVLVRSISGRRPPGCTVN